MVGDLRMQTGGHGEPVLVLLHGLGATSDVWLGWPPLLATAWPGRWIAPDLPGHGGSAPMPSYTFSALAEAVVDALEPGVPAVVLGHSLGGVVGLALAGIPTAAVQAVVGLGIKVNWSEDDLARARALANRPVAWFDSRDEAATRHLRVSGLTGLLTPDDPAVTAAVLAEDGRWRLRLDPALFAIGAPDMVGLLAGAPATVVLARGEHDPMSTDAELARLGATTVMLPGLGHNAHVQNPAACLAALGPFLTRPAGPPRS
ncbi:MAG: alpha/beta fold hydrolase [Micromonosporaceae bacterium]